MAALAFLPAALAEDYSEGPFIVVVETREAFTRWLRDPKPGLEGIEVNGLIGDPEVWALAAQGTVQIPLDVILSDPASEFSALYRLVDVRIVRSVRVTIPAKPGFLKALRLAASLQIPVRILPGQPDGEILSELADAMDFYLRDPMVDAAIEPFHSLLAAFRGIGEETLWGFLEQDPAVYSRRDSVGFLEKPGDFVQTHLARLLLGGAECVTCCWQPLCAGYFKWPDPAYACAGVKRLFALGETAADEITRDLAGHENPASISPR